MIGNNIKALMKERGITQVMLAQKAGISQSTLSAIINGATPKAETAERIALALNVNVSDMQSVGKEHAELYCPRCGSHAVVEWLNHGNGKCRLRCSYCEADTGEQKDAEHAVAVFNSFAHSAERRAEKSVHVLSLAELLDSSCADSDDVRPAWFENRGLFIVPALIQYGMSERELEIVKVLWFGSMSAKSYLLSTYNEAWRVWGGKPTPARSDAEPWKE